MEFARFLRPFYQNDCLILHAAKYLNLFMAVSFSCPYLHRTTGDTERKYHLRYYKTGSCIHETDARGHCVKNGLHCAFAHGPHDLRPPVYDIR